MHLRSAFLWLALAAGLQPAAALGAPAPTTFAEVVEAVAARPEYRHAMIGLEVYALDTRETLFSLNGNKLFTPGSTTKLLSEGTALRLLGPEYRFHTPVYRTGAVDAQGVLHGDLVLVASGDANLSDRLQPDGALAFADEDHSYGGPQSRLVPGDPLIVLKELAQGVARSGVKHVTGAVLVDVSLFPEGEKELGTQVVISPIVVNDNLVDLTISPGDAVGGPAKVLIGAAAPYMKFDNQILTSAEPKSALPRGKTIDNPDGTQTILLTGSISQTSGPVIRGYAPPSPSRYASTMFKACLEEAGVVVDGAPGALVADEKWKPYFKPQFMLAEHVSAPLKEDVKVTLKVSQNLHASTTPFVLGAVVGHATEKIDAAGFALEKEMLVKAGLDVSGASQSDGAGGAAAAFYTPNFMVRYLAYMARQPDYDIFHRALPILGRDGTLVDTQKNAPGAGHVFAKTGTFGAPDLLNATSMLTGKGLAGYITSKEGRPLAFAFYINHVEVEGERSASSVAGDALGELASAVYDLPLGGRDAPAVGPR